MFDAGCLDKLEAIIEHRKPLLRKEAIWAISNVLAESSQILGQIHPSSALFARLLNCIILDVTAVNFEYKTSVLNIILDQIGSNGLLYKCTDCCKHDPGRINYKIGTH